MPYPFKLPTTSFLAFQDYLSSSTHPSLPFSATISRAVVRNALKKHRRLAQPLQSSHLADVLAAFNDYIPYLLAINAGLSGHGVQGEELAIVLEKEIHVEWRVVLTTNVPGRDPARVRLNSLEHEILFTLSTLAATYCLLARTCLHSLYDVQTPTVEQRTTTISTAMKYLVDASSIYKYLFNRVSHLSLAPPSPDVASSTFSALASCTLAEATLVAVLKDDPYPATVAQVRNVQDKEWMYKAPQISSVRALLFARLCIAAADHASKSRGMVQASNKISESLPRYIDDLKSTARAKAFRFHGIDAELAGKTGEGIAWLRAAQMELGFSASGSDVEKKSKIFSKLKKDLLEKREDRRIEKGGEWGGDAGRFEEGRVVDMLMVKWNKINSIMNVQQVPPFELLLAKLPSGREFHNAKVWEPPTLDPATISNLRSPPSQSQARAHRDDDDSDVEEFASGTPVGAYPGTEGSYSTNHQYY